MADFYLAVLYNYWRGTGNPQSDSSSLSTVSPKRKIHAKHVPSKDNCVVCSVDNPSLAKLLR